MNNQQISLINIRTRILVVDNDPQSRVVSQSLLLDGGYDPVLAIGIGGKLIADAKAKARDKCCALALIDLRLYDDADNKDDSGLKLASDLGERIQCIILSGYADQQILIEMIRNHKNLNFILKTSTPDSIMEAIDAEARKVSAAKRGLKFENLDILGEISQTNFGVLAGKYPDQIADVFAKLFPSAVSLRLEKPKKDEYNINQNKLLPSVNVEVYEDGTLQPVKVKLDSALQIKQVVSYYDTYLIGISGTALLQHAILWDIGGIKYLDSDSPSNEGSFRKL